MKRRLFFVYGAANYLLFFALYAYFCLFTANLFLPRTIDKPASSFSTEVAVGIDLALLVAFGLQHSIMARPGFKSVWTRFVPQPIERATYLLASSAVLSAAIAFWQPLPRWCGIFRTRWAGLPCGHFLPVAG
jgi:protein-S-isoprenylcysteine O-methyltransferase Ste14